MTNKLADLCLFIIFIIMSVGLVGVILKLVATIFGLA